MSSILSFILGIVCGEIISVALYALLSANRSDKK